MKRKLSCFLGMVICLILVVCLIPAVASAAETQQLGTPKDLTWNQYVDFGKWPHEPQLSYGSVAWKATEPYSPAEPIQFEIKVYRNGNLWNTVTWGFDPNLVTGGNYISCDLYAQKEFETGTYYFTVQAIDATGTYAGSEVAKSETWKYTKPSKKLAAPTNLRWDTGDTIQDWPWAKWDAVPGHEPNYEVFMYYSSTKDGEWHWFHQQWNIHTTQNCPPLFAIEDGLFGPGYYFFRVRANSNSIVEVSNSPWAESKPYHWGMDTPEVKITAVESSGKPKLSWGKVEFAEKYQIYRSTSKSSGYEHLKTTSSTSFTDTSAKAGKTYYYKVRAIAADVEFYYSDGLVTEPGYKSSFSAPVSRCCDLRQPVVTAKNDSSSGKIRLTWEKVSGAEKYMVYRKSSTDGSYSRIATTISASYTDSSAKAGTKYYYKVMAVHDNTSANSAKSETVSCICRLARPNVTGKLKSNGDPRLTWSKVSGAEKYYIYRAASKTGEYTRIKSTTSTSFTDTTAKSGKTYYYKVKAVHSDTAANSVYSAVDSIRAK